MKKHLAIFSFITLAIGCTQNPQYRLGHFTVASSYNLEHINYEIDSKIPVFGEDCYRSNGTPNDSRLQRAMDNAIANGQKQGSNGNLLMNVRIDQVNKHKPGFMGLPMMHNCIEVEGQLVTLKPAQR